VQASLLTRDLGAVTAAGAPTAQWSFLYTLYLVVVYGLFGIHPLEARLIQAVIVGITTLSCLLDRKALFRGTSGANRRLDYHRIRIP
jgi:hypothetical protein